MDFKKDIIAVMSYSLGVTEEELMTRPEVRGIVSLLDLSNRLREEAGKIESGEITSLNPDAPERLLTVSRALDIQISETVFAGFLIPAVSRLSDADRAKALKATVEAHPSLGYVSRYIPTEETVGFTDEDLIEMREDILGRRISFSKMKELVEAINKNYISGEDISEDIDNLYNDVSQVEKKVTEITPYIQKRMEEKAKRLIELKTQPQTDEVRREIAELENSVKAEFGNLPNYADVFGSIVDSVTVDLETEAAYEAMRAADEAARRAFESEDDVEHPPIEQTKESRFLINDKTGEIIDNRTHKKPERIKNFVYATGNTEITPSRQDTEVMEMFMNTYLRSVLPNPNTISGQKKLAAIKEKMEPEHGANWYEVYKQGIVRSYVASWKETTGFLQKPHIEEGVVERTRGEERTTPVSFEEMTFTLSKFEKRFNAEGEEVLYIKDTDKVVTSPKTKATYEFGVAWAQAFGKTVAEDGTIVLKTSVAFDPKKEAMFNAVQAGINHSFEEKGELDIETVMESLPEEMRTEDMTELLTRTYDQSVEFYNVQVPGGRTAARTEGRSV